MKVAQLSYPHSLSAFGDVFDGLDRPCNPVCAGSVVRALLDNGSGGLNLITPECWSFSTTEPRTWLIDGIKHMR